MNKFHIAHACANGNAHAAQLLESIHAFFHAIDDRFDEDTECSDEGMAGVTMNFILTIGGNPFYQHNRLGYEALIQASISAWVDANRLEEEGKIEGKFLKSLYHELFWHTAQLTGGWSHRRDVSKRFRTFKLENYVPAEKTSNA